MDILGIYRNLFTKAVRDYKVGDTIRTTICVQLGGFINRGIHYSGFITSIDYDKRVIIIDYDPKAELLLSLKPKQVYSNETLRERQGLKPLGDFITPSGY